MAPLAAQDDGAVTDEPASAQDTGEEAAAAANAARAKQQFDGINLLVTVPSSKSDALIEEDCEEENEAAKIRGEIVVCRQLGEATDGSWNKSEWEKRYAAKTKGGSTPDTFGIPNHGPSIRLGSVPEAAIMIDVEALPQAPEGSDADRIARGLKPLGSNPEPTPEEIRERRRALGLDAPPVPEE